MTESIKTGLKFDNSFIKQLKEFYVPTKEEVAPKAKLIKFNNVLAEELGLKYDNLNGGDLAWLLSGSIPAKGAEPVAQVYDGHQFGSFNPQLGDGRAALGSVLREYIMGESMHALSIPATRGLAVTMTGEKVTRQHLY